jgi:hypothetical protein
VPAFLARKEEEDQTQLRDLGVWRNGIAARLFAADLRSASESGKIAIFYMQPVRDDIANDSFRRIRKHLDMDIAYIDALAADYPETSLQIVTSSAYSTPEPFDFRDKYHLRHGQGVVDMLIGLLGDTGLKVEVTDISRNYWPGEIGKNERKNKNKNKKKPKKGKHGAL